MYQLRDYQERAFTEVLEYYNSPSKKKAIIIAPCAAGKSLYIAATANAIDDNILVIQPNKELLAQNYEKYISYGNEASIYSASMGSKEIGKVTFATPLSLKGKAGLFQKVGLVYQDECHQFGKVGGVMDDFIKKLRNPKIIGLTATPVIQRSGMYGTELKMLNRTRDTYYNDIIHVTQIEELINKKFWTDIKYEVYKTDEEYLSPNTSFTEFTDASLDLYVYNNDIEDKIIDILKENKRENYLIFAPTTKQAISLHHRIRGSRVLLNSTNKKERNKSVKDFMSGDLRVLINVNILSTGFDYPKLSCVIDYAPTLSVSRFYQRWARAVRIDKNKKDALIIDLAGNYERFGKLEDINYRNVEGYGWGMFTGDYCLTAAPLDVGKIHINSLIKKKEISKEDIYNLEIHFGKHKGRRVADVAKTDGSYLSWLIGNKDFQWNGQKMLDLKKSIEAHLNNYIVGGGK